MNQHISGNPLSKIARRTLIIVLLIIASVAEATEVLACAATLEEPLALQFENADVIVSGRIVQIKSNPHPDDAPRFWFPNFDLRDLFYSSSDARIVEIEVLELFKGEYTSSGTFYAPVSSMCTYTGLFRQVDAIILLRKRRGKLHWMKTYAPPTLVSESAREYFSTLPSEVRDTSYMKERLAVCRTLGSFSVRIAL